MPRSVNEIAADFDALTAADFDLDSDLGVSGWEKLDRLCSEMRELNDPSACAPVMFRTVMLGGCSRLSHTSMKLEKSGAITTPCVPGSDVSCSVSPPSNDTRNRWRSSGLVRQPTKYS